MQPDEHGLLDQFPVGCLVVTPDRRIQHANAYLADLLQRSNAELEGRELPDLLTGGSVAMFETYIVPLLANEGRFEELSIQLVDADDRAVPVIACAWRIEATGNTHWTFVSAVGRDRLYQELVGARRSLEQRAAELAERAATDGLTGLISRAEFDRHADIMMSRAERSDQPVTVMLVDIDCFKQVNDELGHGAGDAILRTMGPLLRHAVRRGDVVARYGGDEFVIMLGDADEQCARTVADRINEAARRIDAGEHHATVSIGAATAQARDRLDFRTLCERADTALYQAKRRGRDRAVIEPRG